MIKVKRIYDKPEASDGFRVLDDRLWARGLTKEKAKIDSWVRDAAPSTALRTYFQHDPEKWNEFRKRYKAELRSGDGFQKLKEELKGHKTVTLLYGAKDEAHNNAIVLREMLSGK